MPLGNGGVKSLSVKGKGRSRARRIRDMHPPLVSCRSVYCYERLNHIEEGSYGIVFRAKCKETGDIVALKKLKMDKEKNGFPITSLREIETLMTANHENIVRVREIVVGDTLTQVFIVMDFVEHDLKSLLSTMPTPFLASEVKTLLMQLLSAMALCHDNWIVHRDLKTSNLLMNNRGQIKVADFGLARMFGEPLGDMTQLVVTLWYRSPELLLGVTEYTTAVDMWSIGCIFGELILKEPLLPGKGEIDQVAKIFNLLGRPTEEVWPGFSKLPNAKSFNLTAAQPYSNLRQKFRYTTAHGLDLLSQLLAYDPAKRISAEQALKHPYFEESPLPKHSDLFASFPSVAAGEKKSVFASPDAPVREEV
ncbi:Pkinase-domain-containing protein [Meredithblackwellia eburnea MCA 4105]